VRGGGSGGRRAAWGCKRPEGVAVGQGRAVCLMVLQVV
jgi:hypothetical protein